MKKPLYLGLLALVLPATAALAQERIEGKVIGTRLTFCAFDRKIGGCAGALALQTEREGKSAEMTFEVPLGTPITQGREVVYLPALRGKMVAITHVVDKNQRVAKAIEVSR